MLGNNLCIYFFDQFHCQRHRWHIHSNRKLTKDVAVNNVVILFNFMLEILTSEPFLSSIVTEHVQRDEAIQSGSTNGAAEDIFDLNKNVRSSITRNNGGFS